MRRLLSLLVLPALAVAAVSRRQTAYDDDGTIPAWLSDSSHPLRKDMDAITAVVRGADGEELLSSVQGHQNLEFDKPMPADARFMIGSNTKLYTTVAIYQLQEAGKLNVTADIATMLDKNDFENFGWPNQSTFCPMLPGGTECETITLRQMLGMQSGFYPQLNCFVDETARGQCNRDVYTSSNEDIGAVVGAFINMPLMFKPGTQYHYSNPNFVLASYFVEKYSGVKFGAYLKSHIIDVLGLQNTYFDHFNGQLGKFDKLRTYEYYKYYDNETFARLDYGSLRWQLDTGSVAGTGGLISSPADERQLYWAVFNKTTRGAPLLSDPASQAAIIGPWTFCRKQEFGDEEAWVYYAQGVGIICRQELCADGVSYITYTGGTFATDTQNTLDYNDGNYTMAQVWASTKQAQCSASQLAETQASEVGIPMIIVAYWTANSPDAEAMGWDLILKYGSAQLSNHDDDERRQRRALALADAARALRPSSTNDSDNKNRV